MAATHTKVDDRRDSPQLHRAGSRFRTDASESHVIASQATALLDLLLTNIHSSTDFCLHLFDATSLPGNGEDPAIAPIKVSAGSSVSIVVPHQFNTGITLAGSSTAATLTVLTSNAIVMASGHTQVDLSS